MIKLHSRRGDSKKTESSVHSARIPNHKSDNSKFGSRLAPLRAWHARMSRAAFYSFDGIAPVSRVGGGAHLNQDIVKHALMRAVEGT